MKRNLFLIFIISLAFVVPLVLATDVTIKAPADHTVTVTVLTPGEGYGYISSFTQETGARGEAKGNFTASIPKVDVAVLLRFNGEKVSYTRYGPFDVSKPIFIDLNGNSTSSSSTETNVSIAIVNVTVGATETTNTTSNSSKPATNLSVVVKETENETQDTRANKSISALAVSNNNSILSNKMIFISLGIVLVIVIFFFVFRMKGTGKGRDVGAWFYHREVSRDGYRSDKDLATVEKKLKETHDEINKIKNRNERLSEAEKKFEEARRELDRLKK